MTDTPQRCQNCGPIAFCAECAKVNRIRDLLTDVEADWGFEYAYDDGLRALRELRRIFGGEPHRNVVSDYDLTPDAN